VRLINLACYSFVENIRELVGAMDEKGAGRGILVTTSWFTAGCWIKAEQNNRIELIDGPRLRHLVNRAFAHRRPSGPQRRGPHVASVDLTAAATDTGQRDPLTRAFECSASRDVGSFNAPRRNTSSLARSRLAVTDFVAAITPSALRADDAQRGVVCGQ
jgi:Restriction endonuclease